MWLNHMTQIIVDIPSVRISDQQLSHKAIRGNKMQIREFNNTNVSLRPLYILPGYILLFCQVKFLWNQTGYSHTASSALEMFTHRKLIHWWHLRVLDPICIVWPLIIIGILSNNLTPYCDPGSAPNVLLHFDIKQIVCFVLESTLTKCNKCKDNIDIADKYQRIHCIR
jgi:hypothetical protein